jgi:DNA ligase-1
MVRFTTLVNLLTISEISQSLMKAKDYNEEEVDPKGWWVSEKLDGVRAFWDGNKFWTQSGIEMKAPREYIRDMPRTALDGELW